MIKTEKIKVYNFDGAFRGLRNPMNSWDRSDSNYCIIDYRKCSTATLISCEHNLQNVFILGEDDLKLAQCMLSGGTDESKFMRQIFVSMDITAPMYW